MQYSAIHNHKVLWRKRRQKQNQDRQPRHNR